MLKKLIAVATIAAILGTTACADVTGPDTQKTGWCPVVSGSGNCQPGS